MSTPDRMARVMDLLARVRANTASADEQALLADAIDAILFITSTGQRYAFEDYLARRESDEPPAVVAAFSSREEAEAWLNNQPSPPDGTHVLIADAYHRVVYAREMNLRRLIPSPSLGHHIEYLMRHGLPAAVATFDTREEADAWLKNQPEPPAQAFIRIAGEHYLAVYHRNVNHRAIYPISIAGRHPLTAPSR